MHARAQALEAKATEADERLRRLYALVENGTTEPDDLLKARVTALKLERETAREALARAQSTRQRQIVIDESRVEAFGGIMRRSTQYSAHRRHQHHVVCTLPMLYGTW